MDYQNLRRLQWRKAVFLPVICHHVLDGFFDSFGEETTLDDDCFQNYNGVGELSNKTDYDSWIILDRYSDASDDKSYSIKRQEEQCTALSV